MKKNILKILVLTILFIIAFNQLYIVNARTVDSRIRDTIDEFCKSLERNSNSVYTYVDNTNEELTNNINNYLYSIKKMEFNTTDVTENNNIISVTGNIDAEGNNWSVKGFTVKFNLQKVEGDYIITDTDLFYVISPEHTMKFVGSILGIVFGIIGGIFLVIIITVIIIILVVKNNKKKKENSINVENKESKEK